MNRVSAGGEFFPEFRTYDATAAVGRINRDADVHLTASLAQRPLKIVEAGDPRYRLPLSQLDSPSDRGGKRGSGVYSCF